MKRTSKVFRNSLGSRIAEHSPEVTGDDGDTYSGGVSIGHESVLCRDEDVFFTYRRLPKFIKWLQAIEKEYNKKGK